MTEPAYPKLPGTEVLIMSSAPSADVLSDGATPAPPGYSNHVGTCIDAAGNIFWAVTVDGPSSGDVDMVIMRRDALSEGWQEIYRFRESVYGKFGYGGCQVIRYGPNAGGLSCGLAERNDANQTVATERIVPAEYARAVCSAYTALEGGGVRLLDAGGGFEGERVITLPTSIPKGISGLNLKVCVVGSAVGQRGRAGPNKLNSGQGMITATVQEPHPARIYDVGVVSVGPNHSLTFWADNGPLISFWVDALGVLY